MRNVSNYIDDNGKKFFSEAGFEPFDPDCDSIVWDYGDEGYYGYDPGSSLPYEAYT